MSEGPRRIAPKRRPGRRPVTGPTTPSTDAVGGAPSAGGSTGTTARSERGPRIIPPGPPPDDVRIRTRGLTKAYGDLVAVDHLDLDVKAGEIFGLLGQNGAGKTTTILMLLGLTEPTSGQAWVAGLDPARGPLEVKRRVGYMPDSVGFYGDMTGRENLRYTARLNRIDRSEAEVTIEAVLDQVGLTDRADSRVDTYSRGMLQRLGIADALVKDPDILILDEPTTAIDPLGVVEILDLLRALVRERGLTILLSSHLLNQVQSVCDRIGIFAAGRLIGQGTMGELASRFGDGVGHLEVGFDVSDPVEVDRITAALAALEGVAVVTPPSAGQRIWAVTLEPAVAAPPVRSAMLSLVAAQALPMTSIREIVPSLEDVYRRAVGRTGRGREVAA
jgi:ABC-2 type transport system ATP-binding protein